LKQEEWTKYGEVLKAMLSK